MAAMLGGLAPAGWALFILVRLGVGGSLAFHGYQKATGGLKHGQDLMTRMGLPPVMADLTTLLELLGGICLVVGLLTRVAGLLFALEFASICWMKSAKMGAKLFNEPGKPSYELEFLYLMLGVVFLCVGPGPYSLDRVFGI